MIIHDEMESVILLYKANNILEHQLTEMTDTFSKQ